MCVSDVPVAVFELIQKARESEKPWFPYRRARLTYIASSPPVDTGLLLAVVVLTHRHEAASQGLIFQLQRKGFEMGLRKNLRGRGSATAKVGRSSLDPDSCFCPGGPESCNVVVEVADSQSMASARVKAALWCQRPSMRAVILVGIHAETSTITVSKVVPEFRGIDPRSVLSRFSQDLYPQEVACVVIRPVADVPGADAPVAYEVDPDHDQSIALAYDDMTREPPPPAGKHDFVLDAEFFCEWAQEVWE